MKRFGQARPGNQLRPSPPPGWWSTVAAGIRLAAIAAALVATTAPASADDDTKGRTIATTGDAEVFVTPDEVVVNFGIETSGRELDQVVAANDKASARLIKAIKELGVPEKSIQTDNLAVEIRYDGPQMQTAGFITRRGYSVILSDVQKFQRLVQTAIASGANRMMGFEFRTTKLKQYRAEARRMAIEAAQSKAEQMAAVLNARIGAPRSINEGQGYAGYWGTRWSMFNSLAQNAEQAGGGAEGGQNLPLGQIAVRAQVSVTFDLIPPGTK